MKIIKLHGEPASLFCKEIKLEAETLFDIYNGINANYPGFNNYIIDKHKKGLSFYFTDKNNDIVNAGSFKDKSGVYNMHLHVMGAGGAGAFLQGGLIGGIQGFGASWFVNWLQKKMNPKKEKRDPIKTNSYIYTQNENIASQGTTLPVGYGQLRIGSKVISSSLTNYDFDFDEDMIYPTPPSYDKFFHTSSFIDLKQNSNETVNPINKGDLSKTWIAATIAGQLLAKMAGKHTNNIGTNQYHNSASNPNVSKKEVYGPGSKESGGGDYEDSNQRKKSTIYPEIGDFDEKFRPKSSTENLIEIKDDQGNVVPLSSKADSNPRKVGSRPNWSKLESVSIFRSTEILSEGPIEGLALPITGSNADNGSATYPQNVPTSTIGSSTSRAQVASLKADTDGKLYYYQGTTKLTLMTVGNGGITNQGQDFSNDPTNSAYPVFTVGKPANASETNIGSHIFTPTETGLANFRNYNDTADLTNVKYLSGSANPVFVLLEDEGSFRFSPGQTFQSTYGMAFGGNGAKRSADFEKMVLDDDDVFNMSLSMGRGHTDTTSIAKDISPIKQNVEFEFDITNPSEFFSIQASIFDASRTFDISTVHANANAVISRLDSIKDASVPEAGLAWAEMLRIYPDMNSLSAGQLNAEKELVIGTAGTKNLTIKVTLQQVIDGTFDGKIWKDGADFASISAAGGIAATWNDDYTEGTTLSRKVTGKLLALNYSGVTTRSVRDDQDDTLGLKTFQMGPGSNGTEKGYDSRIDFSGKNDLSGLTVIKDGTIYEDPLQAKLEESTLRGDYYPGIFPRVTFFVIRKYEIRASETTSGTAILPTLIEAVAKIKKDGTVDSLILLKNPVHSVYDTMVEKNGDASSALTPIQPFGLDDGRNTDNHTVGGDSEGSRYRYQDCGLIAVIDPSYSSLSLNVHKNQDGQVYAPAVDAYDNFVKIRESWDGHIKNVATSPAAAGNAGGAGFFNFINTYPSSTAPLAGDKTQTFWIVPEDNDIATPTTKAQCKIDTEEIDISTGYRVSSIAADWNSGSACTKILTGRPISVSIISNGAGYTGGPATFSQSLISKTRQSINRVTIKRSSTSNKGYKPNNTFYLYPISNLSKQSGGLSDANKYKLHAARLKVTTDNMGSIDNVQILQRGYGFHIDEDSSDVIFPTDYISSSKTNGTVLNDENQTDYSPAFWDGVAANTALTLTLETYDPVNQNYKKLTITTAGLGFTPHDLIDNPFSDSIGFTAPTLTPTLSGNKLLSVTITDPGKGYTIDDTSVPVTVNFVRNASPSIDDPLNDDYAWARSIYLNEIPMRDKNGYFNFSKFDFDLMVGHYKARDIRHPVDLSNNTIWSRSLIKKEYRYPMQTEVVNYPLIGPRNQDDKDYYFSHAVKNPNVDSIILSFKIEKLYYVYEGDKEVVHVNLIPVLTAIMGVMIGKAIGDMIADLVLPAPATTKVIGQTSPQTCPGSPLSVTGTGTGFSFSITSLMKGLAKALISTAAAAIGGILGYLVGSGIPCKLAPFLCFKIGEVIENSGELWPATCRFKIEYGTEGSNLLTKELTIQGVATQSYVKDVLIDLPTSNSLNNNYINRIVKIYRTTREMDPVRNGLSDARFQILPTVHSVTEIVDAEFSYPNTSYIGLRTNSKDFSSPPKREYLLKLKKVKIPNNYDPLARSFPGPSFYDGVWDGGFKQVSSKDGLFWTSNPAWIIYDILTNNTFGLGKFGLIESDIDKWSFYTFAQSCDELVDVVIDGVATTERRHMCNIYIDDSRDAYAFIRSLLDVYNAQLSWASGKLAIVQDSKKTEGPVMLFTNTNVGEESFSYTSSSQASRYTACTVAYVDERDNYRSKVEYVEDVEGIKKYGYKKLEIPGIGITRKGEAHRLAWHKILSFQMETEFIEFTAGIEASYLRAGDVIQVVDNHKIAKRSGGRISKIVNSTTIEIDMPTSILPAVGSSLILEKPASSDDTSDTSDSSEILDRRSPQYLEYEIDSKSGFQVIFTTSIDSSIIAGYNWIIKENSSDKIKPKYYKIEFMSEDSPLNFKVRASEYFDKKYEYIDNSTSSKDGINITERAYYGHSIDTSGGLTI